jgi:hypothetical protein
MVPHIWLIAGGSHGLISMAPSLVSSNQRPATPVGAIVVPGAGGGCGAASDWRPAGGAGVTGGGVLAVGAVYVTCAAAGSVSPAAMSATTEKSTTVCMDVMDDPPVEAMDNHNRLLYSHNRRRQQQLPCSVTFLRLTLQDAHMRCAPEISRNCEIGLSKV